jgi:hypothetical protein
MVLFRQHVSWAWDRSARVNGVVWNVFIDAISNGSRGGRTEETMGGVGCRCSAATNIGTLLLRAVRVRLS